MSEKTIGVFGGTWVEENSPQYREGLAVGRLLAQAGFAVMSGGYTGVMEAVSRGAKEAGGRVIGVTATYFAGQGFSGNAWLDEEIELSTLLARLEHLTTQADGCLVLWGSVGTMAELFVTWNLVRSRVLPRRPIVLLGRRWQRILEVLASETGITEQELALVQAVEAPAEAVSALQAVLS